MGERERDPRRRVRCGPSMSAMKERSILSVSTGRLRQVRQDENPVPKSSMETVMPRRGEPAGLAMSGSAITAVSVISSSSSAPAAGPGERLETIAGKSPPTRERGDVHRDRERTARGAPRPPAGLFEHPGVSGRIRPVSSAMGMKEPGCSSPCAGGSSAPAPRRVHLARVELGLRLVVQHELVVLHRLAQLGEKLQLVDVVRVEVGAVGDGAGARALRGVHRDVGALQQSGDVVASSGSVPRRRWPARRGAPLGP